MLTILLFLKGLEIISQPFIVLSIRFSSQIYVLFCGKDFISSKLNIRAGFSKGPCCTVKVLVIASHHSLTSFSSCVNGHLTSPYHNTDIWNIFYNIIVKKMKMLIRKTSINMKMTAKPIFIINL